MFCFHPENGDGSYIWGWHTEKQNIFPFISLKNRGFFGNVWKLCYAGVLLKIEARLLGFLINVLANYQIIKKICAPGTLEPPFFYHYTNFWISMCNILPQQSQTIKQTDRHAGRNFLLLIY